MKTPYNYRDVIAEGIKKRQYPERLYKYRTLESAIKTLEGPSIYVSSIQNFNDPYEGHFVLDACNTEQEWKQFLKREAPEMNINERNARARELSTNPSKERRIIEPIINQVLQSSGVYCFSKNWNHIATWAYYSEDHRGICIEFDPLAEEELCEILLPVNYSDDYVNFNYLRKPEGPRDAILQKATCWKHEEEFRIIKNERANQVISINPKSITSIILGCRFEEGIKENSNRKDLLIKLINIINDSKYSHLQIKQCVQQKDKYELELKTIKLYDLQELV